MKLPSVKSIVSIANRFSNKVQKYSPEILVVTTVVGVVSTAIMAGRATLKAKEIVEHENLDPIHDGKFEVEDAKMAAKATWHCFVPPVLAGAVTIASAVSCYKIQTGRTAAMAALYATATKALEETQKAEADILNSKQRDQVREKRAEKLLSDNPIENADIYMTNKGNTLCYDVLSGRYFKSDIEVIRKAMNDFNYQLLGDYCCSLNEWYGYLSLDTIGLGDDVGWSINKKLELNFVSRLASNGTPCLVVDYTVMPIFDYRNMV